MDSKFGSVPTALRKNGNRNFTMRGDLAWSRAQTARLTVRGAVSLVFV
jgi:hypothetical protein